jgi:hypothetical protein
MSKKNWDFPVKGTRRKTSKKDKKTIDELLAKKKAEIEALEAMAKGEDMSSLVARAIEITSELEQAKELYKERDEIIEHLLETGETQFEYDDTTLTLVDMFAEKNKQWKSVPFTRFTMEVTYKK